MGARSSLPQGDLGQTNTMYFNDELQQWVEPGQEHLVERKQPLAPPPAVGEVRKLQQHMKHTEPESIGGILCTPPSAHLHVLRSKVPQAPRSKVPQAPQHPCLAPALPQLPRPTPPMSSVQPGSEVGLDTGSCGTVVQVMNVASLGKVDTMPVQGDLLTGIGHEIQTCGSQKYDCIDSLPKPLQESSGHPASELKAMKLELDSLKTRCAEQEQQIQDLQAKLRWVFFPKSLGLVLCLLLMPMTGYRVDYCVGAFIGISSLLATVQSDLLHFSRSNQVSSSRATFV